MNTSELPADVTVRHHFEPGDLGELIALHGRSNRNDYGFDATHEAYCARIAADFIIDGGGPRGRVWLLKHVDRIAGSVFVVERDDGDAQLRLLYVAPALRGRGLGRWLVRAAVAHAREQGFQRIVLWTVDGLDRAQHLYVEAGFVVDAEQPAPDWGRAARELRYVLTLR